MLRDYDKPAQTFRQQLELLKSRGLVIADESEALNQLSAISYYRLSGYWYPFRERTEQGHVTSRFRQGTSFDQVLALYEFDRQSHFLVMDAIERVEVAVRTRLT